MFNLCILNYLILEMEAWEQGKGKSFFQDSFCKSEPL